MFKSSLAFLCLCSIYISNVQADKFCGINGHGNEYTCSDDQLCCDPNGAGGQGLCCQSSISGLWYVWVILVFVLVVLGIVLRYLWIRRLLFRRQRTCKQVKVFQNPINMNTDQTPLPA